MRTLTLLAALLALAACGRVGPVRPPGPPGSIIYPRPYPYFPPGALPGAAPPVGAGGTTGSAGSASPAQGEGSPVPADNAARESGAGGVNRPASPR